MSPTMLPVSQILISSDPHIPPPLAGRMQTVKHHLGAEQYRLYNNEALRAFIAGHFPSEVTAAYDALKPYSYKSNLGRYCLLLQNGGWYCDCGITWASPFTPPDDIDYVIFRDIQSNSRSNWACAGGVMFARPGQKFFQTAIELVLTHVKNRYYGVTPLCVSGPSVLGRALAAHGASERSLYGDYVELTPGATARNNAFVLQSGQILAYGKNFADAGLAFLGLQGGNSYNQIWLDRDVYK